MFRADYLGGLPIETLSRINPAQVVIHEQNADGTFKLEIHMACSMNSTGRMNISGRAPAGLLPKKVTVNGKEIWAEN
ncbi:hypothetical protein ANCCAN_04757 [Ancylostoma caninum]|uniref:Uncharacterized protein n=1 Tax=Ancylostoma caninum TaxID=29170 RepID=A0A368GXX3_ANCCA|nr:hypothetical protein ANCCAN_04757 [Ancylostoma caninum]